MIHKSIHKAINMIATSAMTLSVKAQVCSVDLKEEYTPQTCFDDAEASLGEIISWVHARVEDHTNSKLLIVFEDCFRNPAFTVVITVAGAYTELNAVRTASGDDISLLFY